MINNSFNIWVDTGGTFTDCICLTPDNEIKRLKVLSSSGLRGKIVRELSPTQFEVSTVWNSTKNIFNDYTLKIFGIDATSKIKHFDIHNKIIQLHGNPFNQPIVNREFEVTAFEEAPILAARLATSTSLDEDFPHLEMRLGTTRGTNALLERKGARVCLIVTKGFKDLIEIGTQQRPDLFALKVIKHPPLYSHVIEIEERMDKDGKAITQLSESAISACIDRLNAIQPETIAVGFVNSYKNNQHELVLKKHLNAAGFTFISLSSEMAREIKILPRTLTTTVNSYLEPIIKSYLDSVRRAIKNNPLKVMTSFGGLVDSGLFLAKDSLLSGPAGGVVGSMKVAKELGYEKIITFDMGGTSTDVSRIDGNFDYQFETEIDHIPIFSPVISIETVAAGGGSICGFDGYKLTVGPQSAGANPGPACYGVGGPLAITDINLLLGRLDENSFDIPLNRSSAQMAFRKIKDQIPGDQSDEEILMGYLQIANEKMADAIRKISLRKGHDPKNFTLLAFGGAGGQNACALADLLNIETIIIPFDAGLLSALGIGKADIERFSQKQILKPLSTFLNEIDEEFGKLEDEGLEQLVAENYTREECFVKLRQVFLRFKGQENCLEINYEHAENIPGQFKEKYSRTYGHWLDDEQIEVESIKVVVTGKREEEEKSRLEMKSYHPKPKGFIQSFVKERWQKTPTYQWEDLREGAKMEGPAILLSQNSTIFLEQNWELKLEAGKNALLNRQSEKRETVVSLNEFADLELFTNRFRAIAEDMGAILQRSSFSVNVKERLDFSCAVLDRQGYLVANAPHIPVHLGSLGICVRSVIQSLKIGPGDVVITNHPKFGGSHLPDITLIGAVYDENENLVGYVANRAHHAEMGGKTPGSMPPDATKLIEEGVVISPAYLIKNGQAQWQNIKEILKNAKYPSRSIEENIADLNGALASINAGTNELRNLCRQFGQEMVQDFMCRLQDYASSCISRSFDEIPSTKWSATERLDDGTTIKVEIRKSKDKILFDFQGTSPVHPGNLNATLAIVNSAVIYVLRLMVKEDLPLNEGIMKQVELIVPKGTFLNPDFPDDLNECPAVVGGNTEVSQRLADTLIKALELAACSQGTMNNLIFGNERFGFYETICGGTGAGENFHGTSAVHQHMTNTKITDPEIIEFRYPVRLERMEIRKNSGGEGKWKGGDGVIRELTFLDNVNLSLLAQHRKELPFGIKGGKAGKAGEQYVLRKEGEKIILKGIDGIELNSGDRFIIKTPGGGGWGKRDSEK